jgi:hypothetical protein
MSTILRSDAKMLDMKRFTVKLIAIYQKEKQKPPSLCTACHGTNVLSMWTWLGFTLFLFQCTLRTVSRMLHRILSNRAWRLDCSEEIKLMIINRIILFSDLCLIIFFHLYLYCNVLSPKGSHSDIKIRD